MRASTRDFTAHLDRDPEDTTFQLNKILGAREQSMAKSKRRHSNGAEKPRCWTLLDAALAACMVAAKVSAADQSTPQSANALIGNGLSEITVTAQRRTENMQDVPIAIQALTSETLQQLNIENFDDVVKYLPNVTVAGTGPGQSNIYMRGLSIGPATLQGGGAVGDFPTSR